MSRFQLTRGIVIHKGIRYKQGDFLPEEFTEKDRWHTIAPHSIIEIPDDQLPEELTAKAASLSGATQAPIGVAAQAAIKPQAVSQGSISAKVNPASPSTPTGTNTQNK